MYAVLPTIVRILQYYEAYHKVKEGWLGMNSAE